MLGDVSNCIVSKCLRKNTDNFQVLSVDCFYVSLPMEH